MTPSKFGKDYPIWRKIWNNKLDKKRRAGAQLEAILIHLIENGDFKFEERLPPVDLLARKMGTTPGTVRKTYVRLRKIRLIITKRGIGTYVAKKLPLGFIRSSAIPADSRFASLLLHDNEPQIFRSDIVLLGAETPGFARLSTSRYVNFFSRIISELDNGASNGTAFRGEIMLMMQKVLLKRGINISTQQFSLIPQGAALQVVISALVKAGDHVVMDCMQDHVPYHLFSDQNAQVHFCGLGRAGMRLSKLEMLCKSHPVRFVFVRPSGAFPQPYAMTEANREKLVSLSLKYSFFIISMDENYGWWHKQPLAPLVLRKHEGNIVYIGSVNAKLSLTSDLHLVVAHDKIIEAIKVKAYRLNVRSGLYLDLAVARLIEKDWMSGDTDKLLRYYQNLQKELKQLFQRTLAPFAEITLSDAGLVVFVRFNKPVYLKSKVDELVALDVLDLDNNRSVDLNRPVYGIRLGYAGKPYSVWEQVFKLLYLAIYERLSRRQKAGLKLFVV